MKKAKKCTKWTKKNGATKKRKKRQTFLMSARDKANLVVKHCSFVFICLFVCFCYVVDLFSGRLFAVRVFPVNLIYDRVFLLVSFFLFLFFCNCLIFNMGSNEAIVCLGSPHDTEDMRWNITSVALFFRFQSELNATFHELTVVVVVWQLLASNRAQQLSTAALIHCSIRCDVMCMWTPYRKSAVTKNSGLVV